MLTLPTNPEFPLDTSEKERLAAIDELIGIGIGAKFTTADLNSERQKELRREEENFQRLFERKQRS